MGGDGPRTPLGQRPGGRLVEFLDAVARLLAGETVSVEGRYLRLVDAHLNGLPTGNRRVRFLVGGRNPALLAAGASRADVVALSGLGRTLPDGHRHEARWSQPDLDSQLRVVHEAAAEAGATPEVEALVQVITLTEDRAAVFAELEGQISGASAADLSTTPFVPVGTEDEMALQLVNQAERLGIGRYVVREADMDVVERLLRLVGAP